MNRDQLLNTNPNYLHGCHPINLQSYFGDVPFSLRISKTKEVLPAISPRLKCLERLLSDISQRDIPAKEHLAKHLHQRYRRNCKSNTLRNIATSVKQFLSFYQDSGKQYIEQIARDDIEAFVEALQVWPDE